MKFKGPIIRIFSLILLAICLSVNANEKWPSKPLKIVVPSNPGSPSDTVARILSAKLSTKLGQSVIVENKSGAQGSIGLEYIANHPADGTGFGLINLQSVAALSLRTNIVYSLEKSFIPITQLTTESPILVINPRIPAKNMGELVNYLKSNKGQTTYASSGSGTPSHLGMELLGNALGINLLHIPYRGAAAAITDVAAGQADLTLVGSAAALQMIKGNRVRPVAVSSGARISMLPDVQTLAEAGFEKIDLQGWVGLVAPAKTSPEIVAQMQKTVVDILKDPAIIEQLVKTGSYPTTSSPKQFAEFISHESKRWAKIIKDSNIKFE